MICCAIGRFSQMHIAEIDALGVMRARFNIDHRSRVRIKILTSHPTEMVFMDQMGISMAESGHCIESEFTIFCEQETSVVDTDICIDPGNYSIIISNQNALTCHVGLEVTSDRVPGKSWVEKATMRWPDRLRIAMKSIMRRLRGK